MAAQLKVGVVGLHRGQAHIVAFNGNEHCTVVAGCDTSEAYAREVAARLGLAQVYTDYATMLEKEQDLDIVVVSTPDHLHAQMARMALEAGKHVLTEIPMATTLEECRVLVDLCRRTGLKLQMGNELRWWPVMESAHAIISRGELGELYYGEAEYFHNMESFYGPLGYGRENWRAGGAQPQTTMLGGGPHSMDTLRWLMGIDNFAQVQAYGSRKVYPQRGEDDFTVAIYRTEGGVIAKIAVSYGVQRPHCLYYSVYGNEGSFERNRASVLDQPNEQHDLLFLRRIPYLREMIPLPVHRYSRPGVTYTAGHGTSEVFQTADFVDAILQDRAPLIDAVEGARTCAPLICALEAARTGQAVAIPAF
jgi:predicted dehydrogenase